MSTLSSLVARACLAFVPLIIVSGCATQHALSEQTDPLHQQLDRTDATLGSTAATANSALQLAGDNKARLEALSTQLADLSGRCASQQALADKTGALDRRLADLEARLDSTAASAQSMEGLPGKVDRLNAGIDDLQKGQSAQSEQLRQAEQRIVELTGQSTANAGKSETNASQEAGLAARLAKAEKHMDDLSAQVREALVASQQDYIRLHGKVVATVKLTEDKTLYPINSPNLGDGDRAKLDELASRLKSMTEEYHLDIQGHTDNLGTDDNNYALGLARAEVVKRYLHEQKGIPLSRMSVISYGATNPLTTTSYGNRRIVINLLTLNKKD